MFRKNVKKSASVSLYQNNIATLQKGFCCYGKSKDYT